MPNPALSIEPATVHTGAVVTITGRHLDKFREGYQIVIVDGDHIIKLADPDGEALIYDAVPSENAAVDEDEARNRTKAEPLRPQRTKAGRAISARSGREGTFSVTTRFPEYEANKYRNGTAELELQIYTAGTSRFRGPPPGLPTPTASRSRPRRRYMCRRRLRRCSLLHRLPYRPRRRPQHRDRPQSRRRPHSRRPQR